MTTEALTPVRELVCSRCGEFTGEFSREPNPGHVGQCCRALPPVWIRGTTTADYDHPDYEEDEEPERDYPLCESCGSERLILRETVTVVQSRSYSRSDPEGGDTDVWFDSAGYSTDNEEDTGEPQRTLVCASCDHHSAHRIEWC